MTTEFQTMIFLSNFIVMEFPKIGACAMTTKFLDNIICTFKILLSWRFPRETALLDDSPLRPQGPPPSKVQTLDLYCRLAVSDKKNRVFFDTMFP